MEVHGASQLVLGDLGVLQARDLTQPAGSGTEVVGQQRRRVMVKRRHSSGDHHCHTTWEA
jgi:hypothetical protein